MRIGNALTIEVVAVPGGKKLVVSTATPGGHGGFALEARLDGPAELQRLAQELADEAEAWCAGAIGGHPNGPDPFKVLGVDRGAPWEVIAALYRVRAKKEHPDKGGDPASWARVQAAYTELETRKTAADAAKEAV